MVIFSAARLSVDGLEMTFALNHLAYFLLTHLLLDTIKTSAPARIINVSSGAHRNAEIKFDDLMLERGYGPMKAYGQSKLANVFFTYELARRLAGTGVTTNAVHPGWVATNIGRNNGLLARVFHADHPAQRPHPGGRAPRPASTWRRRRSWPG